jgi:CRP/FNR family transcriptional regulator, cyclic AMP receptor protein
MGGCFNNQVEAVMPNKQSKPVDRQAAAVAADKNGQTFDWEAFLAAPDGGKSLREYSADRSIFRQEDPTDSVFYLRQGKVKLSVTSAQGNEAIVALLEANDFFGEASLAGQPLRMESAITVTDCTLVRIEKLIMARLLHEQHGISELFAKRLLSRNLRLEGDLVDQLLNHSEKRLARMLLLLAHFGEENRAEAVLPSINQETLAQMVGTTRSRVSHFMNQFRNCGCIDYKNGGKLTVHSGLLGVVLDGTCKPLGARANGSR